MTEVEEIETIETVDEKTEAVEKPEKVGQWKNGFWVTKIEGTQYLHEVKGNEAIMKNLAQMDYPDIPDQDCNRGTWSHGDFGEAPEALRVSNFSAKFYFKFTDVNSKRTHLF